MVTAPQRQRPRSGMILPGITQLVRIEHLAHTEHDIEIVVVEQPGHTVLFQANAVFTA